MTVTAAADLGVITSASANLRTADDIRVIDTGRPARFKAEDLLGNEIQLNGRTLSLVSVGGATNGRASLLDGEVVFTPESGFRGLASFSYTVTDSLGTSRASGST